MKREIDVYRDGVFIGTFPSMTAFSKEYGVPVSSISKVLHGFMDESHGYVFFERITFSTGRVFIC